MALLIGILIGLVLGLTGAGGSVLALPLLTGLLHLPLATANGLSLGAVACAAVPGVWWRLRRGQVVWPPAGFMMLGGVLLTPLGRLLARQLPAPVLAAGFMLLVVVVAVRMWQQASTNPAAASAVRAWPGDAGPARPACQFDSSGTLQLQLPCIVRLTLAGALTGLLSGLFGVGGGFVIVPALVLLTGLPMANAVATSLLVITVVAGTGFAGFLLEAPAAATLLLPLAGGGVLGMLLGSLLAPRLAGPGLQRLFVVLMLGLAAAMLINILRGH